jgi:hypothetical protein
MMVPASGGGVEVLLRGVFRLKMADCIIRHSLFI